MYSSMQFFTLAFPANSPLSLSLFPGKLPAVIQVPTFKTAHKMMSQELVVTGPVFSKKHNCILLVHWLSKMDNGLAHFTSQESFMPTSWTTIKLSYFRKWKHRTNNYSISLKPHFLNNFFLNKRIILGLKIRLSYSFCRTLQPDFGMVELW